MKYEEPLMEIVKFDFKNNILTASGGENATESPVEIETGTVGDFDPFA